MCSSQVAVKFNCLFLEVVQLT